jgi:hypothetical protein
MSKDVSAQVSTELVGAAAPESLEGFRFAAGLLPALGLVRSLFSQTELDTVLKAMILFELSRARGRFNIDRIRSLASFLPSDRVDALVRALRDGGWLELRDSDRSYALDPVGVQLLSLLYAADLGSLTPANAIARAAQNAEFGAKLDGSQAAVGFLLENLAALLDAQVDAARQILANGRPSPMIAWSRRQHSEQLGTLRAVLDQLQDRLDATSGEFARVVRLHERMQELVRMHTGLHTRLREWNLENLYSSESGYSLHQLCESVLGAEDDALMLAWTRGLVQLPALAPSLSTEEVMTRFHGARRRLAPDAEVFEYAPPDTSPPEAFTAAAADPASALRARLTALFVGRGPDDPPLQLADWLPAPQADDTALGEAAWQLANLCRLEAEGARARLDDGRALVVKTPPADSAGLPSAGLLEGLEARGGLTRLSWGWLSAVELSIAPEVDHG